MILHCTCMYPNTPEALAWLHVQIVTTNLLMRNEACTCQRSAAKKAVAASGTNCDFFILRQCVSLSSVSRTLIVCAMAVAWVKSYSQLHPLCYASSISSQEKH